MPSRLFINLLEGATYSCQRCSSIRSKHSSSIWMKRHVRDKYVKESVDQDLRSRAAFKLKEMNNKYKFLRPGYTVIDLGAAPGGWCEITQAIVGPNGKVVGIDLNEIRPISGVTLLQGDFTDPHMQQRIIEAISLRNASVSDGSQPQQQVATTAGSGMIDVCLSDMAPSFTGDVFTDHIRTLDLCYQVLGFAEKAFVRPGQGTLLIKYFKGRDEKILPERAASIFEEVKSIKPQASRKESSEMYLLARRRRRRQTEEKTTSLL